MATIVIRRRWNDEQITAAVEQVEQWFKDHPKRRVCRTQYHRCRRGHVREDIEAVEKREG